jgi:hypothetical protein
VEYTYVVVLDHNHSNLFVRLSLLSPSHIDLAASVIRKVCSPTMQGIAYQREWHVGKNFTATYVCSGGIRLRTPNRDHGNDRPGKNFEEEG